MNTDNNVVSGDAAGNLTGKEYRVVALTSSGVDLATTATKVIGTLIRAMPVQESGSYAGKSVAIQRKHAGIHFATIGNSSASVAKGAGLILDPSTADNPGKLVPSESSPIAAAWEAFTASDGVIVRVVFL